MSATAGQAADQHDLAERLGVKPGHVVQEIGYDDDCDEELRDAVASGEGVELVDEDYEDVVDVVLMWFREDDGDLVDAPIERSKWKAKGIDMVGLYVGSNDKLPSLQKYFGRSLIRPNIKELGFALQATFSRGALERGRGR